MNETDVAYLYLNPATRIAHTSPECPSYRRAKYGHRVHAHLWRNHADVCSACLRREVKTVEEALQK